MARVLDDKIKKSADILNSLNSILTSSNKIKNFIAGDIVYTNQRMYEKHSIKGACNNQLIVHSYVDDILILKDYHGNLFKLMSNPNNNGDFRWLSYNVYNNPDVVNFYKTPQEAMVGHIKDKLARVITDIEYTDKFLKENLRQLIK